MTGDETLGESASSNGGQPAAPRWPFLPDNVRVADGVDLDADDACYVSEPVNAGQDKHSHRRCIATNHDGQRCGARASHGLLVCPIHSGAMRYQDGHNARRRQGRERQARAERVLQLQRLGTRAIVAEALASEAEKVDRAVRHLVDAAANGDIAAAKALIPWLDQALGKPVERHELRTPSSVEDLEQMPQAELEALVAQGRARRMGLPAAPEPASDQETGVADDDGAAGSDAVADVAQLLPRIP